MNISIIGTGYVGLVTGTCLAEKGHAVTCVDVDQRKVDTINEGIAPIHESGLEDLLNRNIHKRLTATTDLDHAVTETQLSMIAVGTPFDGQTIDLSSVKQATCDIGSILKKKAAYHTVVVKSTVVPGTTDNVVVPIIEEASGKKAGKDFGVGMNPEFLREGEAVEDFFNPDRIVLGGTDKKTHAALEKLYRVFENVDVIKTNNHTAEMIKYTANSLLATLISFSNEIGNLCADLPQVDAVEVMRGVQLDERFSPVLPNAERISPGFIAYLAAGCGFGGSCFPKDVKALIAHGQSKGFDMKLLDSVIKINEEQPEQVLGILKKNFPKFEGLKVAVLGLAFKPGTDDMRESPAIPIIKQLLREGADVQAYDPEARHEARKLFGNRQITYHESLNYRINDVDAIILLTRWDEFNKLPDLLREENGQPVFIDGRRMLPKEEFANYQGIGL